MLTCQPVGHWDKPLPECIGTVVPFNIILEINWQIMLLFMLLLLLRSVISRSSLHRSAYTDPPFCVIGAFYAKYN